MIGHIESKIKDNTKIACWGRWFDVGVRWHEKTVVIDLRKLNMKTNEENSPLH